MTNYNDEALLKEFTQTNQPEYFGELFQRYVPLTYGLCLKYLKDRKSAEDAVMELFEMLLSNISNYEINEFRTWLYIVAKNHCLQTLRKEKRTIVIDSVADEDRESDEIVRLFEEKNRSDIQTEELNRGMEKLSKPQRTSISMFFIDEKSYAEIAEKTGFLLKTVKNHIQNGKRNLKNCLEKHQEV